MRTLLAFLLLCSTALADYALVRRDDGDYLLAPHSNELIKITCVVDQRTGSNPPPPTPPEEPDTPDEPDDAPSERATEIQKLSRGVGTEEEALTLAAVARTLAAEGVSGQVPWEAAFQVTLNRVSGKVPDVWDTWQQNVALLAGDYPPEFFADVAEGLALAHGLTRGDLGAAKLEAEILDRLREHELLGK